MIQDISPYQFDNCYTPVPPDENSFILWYDSSRVLLQKQGDGQIRFPRFADLPAADSIGSTNANSLPPLHL